MEQLGKGAAGTVFRARDSLLGIDVCVKVLHPGLATQPGVIERFKRELLLARRIAHPAICKIFDIQEANGTHFLTMEYVQGETLSAILNRDGQMRPKDAVRLMRKVSEALGAAHKAGVVHRDIKPGNIIIGDNERVTIVDFGVATAEDLDRLTRAGVVLGSRSYMAPETWQGRAANAAGDVWALGVILYGCVTGRLPYKGEGVVGVFDAIKNTKPLPPSAFTDEVTPELEELIFKAMCVEPADRFPDASAVEAALASLELTLSDGDDAATVVRAPTFSPPSAKKVSSPSSPPVTSPAPRSTPSGESALPAPPSSSGSALPAPPSPSDRLHRPQATTPLPRPPSPFSPPGGTAKKPSFPAKSTEEISLVGDLSLYGPAEVSGIGEEPAGQPVDDIAEETRITAPPAASVEHARDAISAENVSAAFDAAFGGPAEDGFGALPSTNADSPVADFSQPPTVAAKSLPTLQTELEPDDMRGMNVLVGQKVVGSVGVEKPFESGREGAQEVTASQPAPSEDGGEASQPFDSVLDFGAPPANEGEATRVVENPLAAARDDGDALGALAAEALASMDKTAVSDGVDSFFAGKPEAPEEEQAPPLFLGEEAPSVEATRIEAFFAPPADAAAAPSDEETHQIERRPKASAADVVEVAERPPSRRGLFAAAGGVALLVVVVGVFAVGGDKPPADGALAANAKAAPVEAVAATDKEPGPKSNDGWLFDEAEGKPAGAAVAAAEAMEEPAPEEPEGTIADESEEAAVVAVAEPVGEEPAAEEPAAEEPVAEEPAAVEAEDEEPVAEDEEPAAVEAEEDEPEPAVASKPRKQRSNPNAVARSKYKRKRSALNSALAKKGIMPGDAPSVDAKRRAMTAAARRNDYDRAAQAADAALAEAGRVTVDAAFVGKKLARFNQGYDKTTDEALRVKLKGVLKEVGADYSKGRYDDANKKLNRAFSLMRR